MQLLKPSWVSADGHALMSVDIHPDGTRFATGGQGPDNCGRVSIWNMAPVLDVKMSKDKSVHKLLTQMDHHLGCVNCTRWSNNGSFLASAGDDKLIMLWQKAAYAGGSIFGGGGKVHVEQWRLHQTLRGHNGDVLDLAWGPGDSVLATASVDNNIIIWNVERLPEQIAILRGHSSLVKGVCFDPVGKYLASQSDDKTLRIWRTSDWSTETVIDEPFQESGGTTHVLRPGWSPEGSMIVTAHAMNGGGPTAQIVDRTGWKVSRDFVGHKKAVSCVRFNPRMFEKKGGDGKMEQFVLVALGSRDRSFSVWSTNLKRPFFVVRDAFDQGVLDLAWSKDGRLLMACSMDGSLACAHLNKNEMGKPIEDHRMYEMMSTAHGKNYGKIANLKTSNVANGGTIIIENPDMLKSSNSNGSSVEKTPTKAKLYPKGPTDKQIESKTSDGKRRITPIFLPPPSTQNGTNGESPRFGSGEFGSSSTQEKSKIAVEKRDTIVVPNVSPNKDSNKSSHHEDCPNANKSKESNSKPPQKQTSASKPAQQKDSNKSPPQANVIQVKKKPSKPHATEPAVNVIQVKKKPGPPAASASSQQPTTKRPSSPSTPAASPTKKRKRLAVISDSSDSSDDDTSSKTTSISNKAPSNKDDKDNKTVKKDFKDFGNAERLKETKIKKPDILSGGRHENLDLDNELPKPKKRGRPSQQLSREVSCTSDGVNQTTTSSEQVQQQQQQPPQQQPQPRTSSSLVPIESLRLPAMKSDKSKTYNFKSSAGRITVNVNNHVVQGKLHELKCSNLDKGSTWSALTSSPVVTCIGGNDLFVVVCKDGSLNLHSLLGFGQSLYPPLLLPSPVSRMALQDNLLAIVTCCANLYFWDMSTSKLRVIMRREPVDSLLLGGGGGHTSIVTKVLISKDTRQPTLVTSGGKCFSYDPDLGSWLRMADTASTVQACSSFASSASNLPRETKDQPLASLTYVTPSPSSSANKMNASQIEEKTRNLATITHCRNQRMAAQYLKSPKEYQYWFLAEVKQHALEANVAALRSCFEWLQKADDESRRVQDALGLNMEDLLKSSLKIIAGNLQLQRLYSEFCDQLNSKSELTEMDNILDV